MSIRQLQLLQDLPNDFDNAEVNVTEDVTIIVEGTLIIESSINSIPHIFGSFRYPTSDRPIWQGIQIVSGSLLIDDVLIEYARGFDIAGSATISPILNQWLGMFRLDGI